MKNVKIKYNNNMNVMISNRGVKYNNILKEIKLIFNAEKPYFIP